MLRDFKLLGIFLNITLFSFGQKPSLIGHWQFVKLQSRLSSDTTLHWQHLKLQPRLGSDTTDHFGDLILREDSTFTDVGDDTPKPSNIPGWHVGGSKNGKWEQKGKLLFFYFEDLPIPVRNQIRRLTKSELWLEDTFDNSPLIKKYKRRE